MSVFNVTPNGRMPRFIWLIGAFALIIFLLSWRSHKAPMTANLENGLLMTPEPTATVFPSPQAIVWEGSITRVFVSGSGLEVRSSSAPGGVFHAFMPDDRIAPVTGGHVLVSGNWTGWSCEYGTQCVPQVEIVKIEQLR